MNTLFNIERNLHRKIIGCLGIITPIILVFSAWVFGCDAVQESISAYYHTKSHKFFTWIVTIIGIFFLAYPILDGYEADSKPFRIAGILAILVAFFPNYIQPDAITDCNIDAVTNLNSKTSGYIHNFSAGSFFLILGYICICLFTRSNRTYEEFSEEKKTRTRFYKFSGYIILICIILIVLYEFWLKDKFPEIKEFKPTFILESIALLFFGLAYLIKGQLIFKDKN